MKKERSLLKKGGSVFWVKNGGILLISRRKHNELDGY